jgi:hypothetical protein
MRAALGLLVAAAVAVVAGLAIPASVVRASGVALGASELNRELTVLAKDPQFFCYLQALEYTQTSSQSQGASTWVSPKGASPQVFSADGAVQWANKRTTQLVVDRYVEVHHPQAFAPAALAAARSDFEAAMSETFQAAYQQSQGTLSCAGTATGTTALQQLPGWFAAEQVRAEAANLGLAALVKDPVPTQGPGLRRFFDQNASGFDTTCVSDLLVMTQQEATAIVQAIDQGLPIDTAAKRYSQPTTQTGQRGGSIGCFSPTSPNWAQVTGLLKLVKVGDATVAQVSATQWYVIGPTKRTPNSFASIKSAVVAAAESDNLILSEELSATIQRAAHVTISPELGTWVETNFGGTIVPPASPPLPSVYNVAANAPTT